MLIACSHLKYLYMCRQNVKYLQVKRQNTERIISLIDKGNEVGVLDNRNREKSK